MSPNEYNYTEEIEEGDNAEFVFTNGDKEIKCVITLS